MMKHFEAVTGFQTEDLPYFEDKVGFIAREVNPDAQEGRLDWIVEIAGLPELSDWVPGAKIDVKKLLKLRDSDECREFRQWLRGIDFETDEGIKARFETRTSMCVTPRPRAFA